MYIYSVSITSERGYCGTADVYNERYIITNVGKEELKNDFKKWVKSVKIWKDHRHYIEFAEFISDIKGAICLRGEDIEVACGDIEEVCLIGAYIDADHFLNLSNCFNKEELILLQKEWAFNANTLLKAKTKQKELQNKVAEKARKKAKRDKDIQLLKKLKEQYE